MTGLSFLVANLYVARSWLTSGAEKYLSSWGVSS